MGGMGFELAAFVRGWTKGEQVLVWTEPPGDAWGIGALARELAGGAGLKVRVAGPGHGGLVSGVP
jgi:hypothetical protein